MVPSLHVGEGAGGQLPLLWQKGGAPLRHCPLSDKLEVSSDQNFLSWVQSEIQGVVTRGYLGRPVRGSREEASCKSAGHSEWFMVWILDCLFASTFEPRPLRGEWCPL